MDRDRLKDVQKSELTDDRLNEDFVTWLKTKGPSWLLVLLVAIVAYLFIVNWRQREVRHQNEAWIALVEAQLPTSLEDVANQYPDIDSVAEQARLRAAGMYLQSVHLGRAIGSTSLSPVVLSEEDRLFNLERADALYLQTFEDSKDEVNGTLIAVTALNGRAAVAESRGDLDAARALYEQAADHAGTTFPFIAARASARAASVAEYDILVAIPEAPAEPVIAPTLPGAAPGSLDELSNPLNLPTLPALPSPSPSPTPEDLPVDEGTPPNTDSP